MRWLHVEATGSDSVLLPPMTSIVIATAVVRACVREREGEGEGEGEREVGGQN